MDYQSKIRRTISDGWEEHTKFVLQTILSQFMALVNEYRVPCYMQNYNGTKKSSNVDPILALEIEISE